MFYRKIIFIFTLLSLALVTTSEMSHADHNEEQAANTIGYTQDTLNNGDQLHVFVFGVEPLTKDIFIDSNGNITLPLIGEIKASGLRKEELEAVITDELSKGGFYKNPNVTVELIALQPFFILGEVRNPGRYDFQTDLNVFKVVAIAGGFTPRAAKGKITISRIVDEKKVSIKATQDTIIFPGDSINVEQRFF